jgi:hypothetical protein
MTQLIGTQLIETAIKSAIATGRVENSDNGPLSLLLIAAPESGKTSMVSKDSKTVLSFSDITGRGITDALKTNPDVTHLIILDMVAIMSHKETVNKYTLAMLNAMTEEGMGTIAYPGSVEKFPNGNKKGLIACLTHDLAKDGRTWWNKTGFASRMLPISFDHSPDLVRKIKESITYGAQIERPTGTTWTLPEKSAIVQMSNQMGSEIQFLASIKSAEFQEKGYRRLKQFRALAKGHALLRTPKKPIVSKPEIEFLRSMLPYISFDKAHQI